MEYFKDATIYRMARCGLHEKWTLERNVGVSTDFEDDVFRSKEQSPGDLLSEVVNLGESPIDDGKGWGCKHDFKGRYRYMNLTAPISMSPTTIMAVMSLLDPLRPRDDR